MSGTFFAQSENQAVPVTAGSGLPGAQFAKLNIYENAKPEVVIADQI